MRNPRLFAEMLATLQAAMDPSDLAAVWARGASMTQDELLALAFSSFHHGGYPLAGAAGPGAPMEEEKASVRSVHRVAAG